MAKKTTRKAVKKTTKKAAAKSLKKTTRKSAKKASKKSTKKAAKKTAKKTKAKKASSKKTKKAAATASPGLKVGDRVPSFSLPATSGAVFTNGDFKGRKTVLYFYPKDNTSGCTLQGQNFRDRHADFARMGVQVIGVSPDSIRSHEGFKSKEGFPFELVSDENRELCEAFGVWKEKSMYGRKYFGVERSTFLIDDEGRVVREWRKVKVPGHVDEVLDCLKG